MKKSSMNSNLIAPCGMNCGVCLGHLREKNPCPGCRIPDKNKPITRIRCKIKTCSSLKGYKKFCFQCSTFPCHNLEHLDNRYRTKYHMSMIENLENIKQLGIKKFLANERIRWACPKCKGTVCVHTHCCSVCGKKLKS